MVFNWQGSFHLYCYRLKYTGSIGAGLLSDILTARAVAVTVLLYLSIPMVSSAISFNMDLMCETMSSHNREIKWSLNPALLLGILPHVYIYNKRFMWGNWKQWKWKPETENGNGQIVI